jgi:hypothetical protein
MPGFVSSVMAYERDGEHAGVVVLANSSAGVDVEGLAADLLTTVLAQVEDADGFDGDELLSLPIVLAVGLLAFLGWSVYRRRSSKPHS